MVFPMPKGIYQRKLRPLADRFWSKVAIGAPDVCWPWTRTHNGRGYGTVGLGRREEGRDYAHRIAWTLTNGPVPSGMDICHCCDNPPCCNPSHLFLGTRAENHSDMMQKGRGSAPPRLIGERNGRAKLTPEQVRWLREVCTPGSRDANSASALARQLGVSYPTVLKAVRSQAWTEL